MNKWGASQKELSWPNIGPRQLLCSSCTGCFSDQVKILDGRGETTAREMSKYSDSAVRYKYKQIVPVSCLS